MTPDQCAAFAEELVRMPTAVLRLLRAHQPDGDRLCRGCGRPGYGTPYRPWPCALYMLARRACVPPSDGSATSAVPTREAA